MHRFLRRFWKLFFDRDTFSVSDGKATPAELKVLHKLIAKAQDDIEHFSFNTTVSAFMIAVGDLTDLGCNKREILEPLLIVLSPFAPHICEELWQLLGHEESISFASFPVYNPAYTVEDTVKYPVQFNGKMRFMIELPKSLSREEVEAAVRADASTEKYLQGAAIRKVIVVPGKIINIVC